jgi:GNAT superfamily N-acetyltransferase
VTTLRITSEPNATREEIRVIQNAVDNWRIAPAPVDGPHDVVIMLRDERREIRGGVIADEKDGWLRIQSLWVDPELQPNVTGAKLLAAAETEARGHDAQGAYLESFTARTRPFYESQGYTVFAAIEDFPPGHDYYLLRKIFSPAQP